MSHSGDELVYLLPKVAIRPIDSAGHFDPASRFEPLGVPISRFVGIIRRHYWVLFISIFVCVGSTLAIVHSMAKEYTAEAALLIEPHRTQVSDLQAISSDPGDVTSLIRTQIDIIKSPTLAIGVVNALHLDQLAEFRQPAKSVLTRLVDEVRRLTHQPLPLPPQLTPEQRIDLAASVLSGKIGFANEARSSVLGVMVTTHNAALSANIANALANEFIEFKRQQKYSAMQQAHDWFQTQLVDLAKQVRTDERAVQAYRTEHGLIDLLSPSDGPSGSPHATSITRQQLSDVTTELMVATRDLSNDEAKLAQAQAAARGQHRGSLPDVIVSPVIAQLLAQEAVAAGHEAELAASEGSNNPQLHAARAQLRQIQGRVAAETGDIVRSLSAEVNAARAQKQALGKRLDELRQAVGREDAAGVGLQALQAQASATRGIYNSFLTRVTQLANVSGIQEPDASLVSPATTPLGPSAPRPLRFVAVSGLLSFVIGVAGACWIERARRGFSSPEQIAATLGVASLTLVPRLTKRNRQQFPNTSHNLNFSASMDRLRGQIRAMGEARPKVIMISSALPQEGKSTLAVGLAVNAATAGWKVLLIDCDFRRPSIADLLHLSAGPGLVEILVGRTLGNNRAAVWEISRNLRVIAAGSPQGDPQELLASNRMAKLLASARRSYDLIILDTPPVLAVPDALMLVRETDAALLVVHWERTPRAVVQDTVRLLHNSQAHILGAALTQVDLHREALSSGRPNAMYDYQTTYRTPRPQPANSDA